MLRRLTAEWIKVVFITVTSSWKRWRLKSPASRLFAQPFFRAQTKENMKAPRHWPLWGEFTGERRIPRTKGSNAELFPFDDVIMFYGDTSEVRLPARLTNYCLKSFESYGARVWNLLPAPCWMGVSFNTFKNVIKTWSGPTWKLTSLSYHNHV